MSCKITRFKDYILKSKRIVFFGGAGVSTESGIPDFRSASGLYNSNKSGISPETMLSHSFFISHTEDFFNYYRKNLVYQNAKPNIVHLKLAELEKKGTLLSVITQNIDGLHQQAGAEKVHELHGSVHKNSCMNCGKKYGSEHIINTDKIPLCTCGGIVKPCVVLYEEMLDNEVVNAAIEDIKAADLLVVGGSSLSVYPAAGFLNYFNSSKNPLVIINKSPTKKDYMAEIVINETLGNVFSVL